MPINKHSVFQEDFLLIFHQSYTLHFQETNHKGSEPYGYWTWLSNTKNSCSLNIATQCTVGGLVIFLSQKAYFNRKNFVEHNGEITNRKPYQKSPTSKQSKKIEKIDKKKLLWQKKKKACKMWWNPFLMSILIFMLLHLHETSLQFVICA